MGERKRVALVTGGARRLGKAIARALAECGYRMVIHYGSSEAAADETVEELQQQGVEAHTVGADLSQPADIDRLFVVLEGRFGRLDVLVNSAASFIKKPVSETASEDWDRVMAVNLRAPLLCTRGAVPLLRSAFLETGRPSSIVNIADLSGVAAWPGYAVHGSSKAGLLQLTDISARELAPEIRVNAVIPGPVLPPPGVGEQAPEWTELIARLPTGRRGWPADIGRAVAYLVEADFVVGTHLYVDGGEHLLGAGHRHL